MNYAEMSAKKLLETLNAVDELDTLEAKSLRDDTSRSILETICSFSNEPGLGGGVILVGVAESKDADGSRYFIDGVEDPDKAQLDLATQCKSVFNTPIYPTIKVEKLCGKTVLKVIVDEVSFGHKPLMIQKGRARGTYYVPSEKLLETSQPRELMSQPTGLISQPQAVTGTAQAVTGTAQAVIGTAQAVTGTALPKGIAEELAKLKRRASPQKMKDLILRLCEVRPMSREELMCYLKRGGTTIDTYISEMIGKELDYLYPMMPHHPRQAYVAKVGEESENLV